MQDAKDICQYCMSHKYEIIQLANQMQDIKHICWYKAHETYVNDQNRTPNEWNLVNILPQINVK